MFNDWLLKQLQEKDWTQSDLARNSGLTNAAISKYINGRIPDEAALRKIARALKLPVETIFRVAGLLPPTSPENELINQIMHLTSELPDQEQQDILEFIKFRQRIVEEREKNASKRTANHPATPR